MNKKIAILALALCMIAAIAVTGTIAYFTDTDKETNVFTIGKVDIDLQEKFDAANAKLFPNVPITKEVAIQNMNDSEEAYVRVHVAFPKILDSGDPNFLAYANKLHWNFSKESVQAGEWTQLNTYGATGPNNNYPYWPGNGGAYNFYETKVDNVDYNVYVITYQKKLVAGQKTATNAIDQVYLDASITDEQLADIQTQLGGQIKVLVFAEGGQVKGFEDPFTALNTQFGDPMKASYVSPWNK